MIKLTLLGEPKSTQHIYRMTCRGKYASVYMSKEGKELKESYQWQIKNQYKGKPLSGSLKIDVKLFFGTKRKNDIDNFSKILLDSFTGFIWIDDSQIMEAHYEKNYDKNHGRIEVIIENI